MKSTFFGRHCFRILLVAVFLLPLVSAGAVRGLLSNRNDVKDWLPASEPETLRFNWFQQFYAGEEFVLVSWEGCTLDDQRLELLSEKLVPADGSVPKLPAGAIPPLRNYPILQSLGLLRQDKQAIGDEPLFESVVTGPSVLERLTTSPINLSREEALERLRGSLIGPDLKQTCAVFTLSPAGRMAPRVSVNTVRIVATEQCGIPAEELHMGGPPVDNSAIDETGERSLYRLAGIAGIVGLVMSWWCLRNLKLIAFVFATGLLTAAGSLAIVWYTGTEMNAILLTMPALTYVAAVSGAIHLSNYYRDTLYEEGLIGAPGRALRHAALPLSLATGTTAVGLLSLCTTNLVPIQQFGLYSAIGVVLGFVLLVLLLPSAFQSWPLRVAASALDRKQPAPAADPIFAQPWWKNVGWSILNHHTAVAVGCVAVMAVCVWGMSKIETSVQLMRLFSSKNRLLTDYAWLEENLGELVPMEVVIKMQQDREKCSLDFLQRMELVEAVQKGIESLPDVGSSLSAVTFAPHLPREEDFPKQRGLTGFLVRDPYKLARQITNKRLESHRDEYLAEDYLAEENGTDLWRISARLAALRDVDYGVFDEKIRAVVEKIVGDETAQKARGIELVYTGLVPLVYKAQRSLLDGLLWGFTLDVILITLAMIVSVREWSAGLLLFLPSVFPIVMVFGVMGWMGVVVDVGTVMAPAVALGVTVDDVVHFMLMYRNGLKQGMDRRNSVMLAYKHCAQPIYQSWGVIGLGLAAFAFSPFSPTQRFGVLMVTLLSAALVGNLVLLPALLASPLGALFGRRFQKKRPRDSDQLTGPAARASKSTRHHPPEKPRTVDLSAGGSRKAS